MKRLIFPKALFVNHPEKNFSDDGNYFRVIYYKDQLPISVLHDSKEEMTYVDIRPDYLGLRWYQYREDSNLLNEFNGVADSGFDMDKFISNCEYALNKYVAKLEELKAQNKAKEQRNEQTKDNARAVIQAAVEEFGFVCKPTWNRATEIVDPEEFVSFTLHEDREYIRNEADLVVSVKNKVTVSANPKTMGGVYTPEDLLKYADSLTRAASAVRRINELGLSYITEA